MAKEVPLYAATAARARLSKIQKQALTTQRESGSMAWPSVRAMLLLRLFTLIFPPSDHRHPVLAPAAIVVGGLLGQCPLASSSDAAAALFLCGIAHTLAVRNVLTQHMNPNSSLCHGSSAAGVARQSSGR
jgi:nucleolar protein 14